MVVCLEFLPGDLYFDKRQRANSVISVDFFCCRKHWLANVGSKKSRITRCDIKNIRALEKSEYPDFSVRR